MGVTLYKQLAPNRNVLLWMGPLPPRAMFGTDESWMLPGYGCTSEVLREQWPQ